MALRSFAYDDPNYTVVRTYCSEKSDVAASTTAFAYFRSRVKIIVNSMTCILLSAASGASAVLTLRRNASAFTTFGVGSATTAGNMTVISVGMTLLSAGESINVISGQVGGEWQIVYEYNVIPGASLYSNQ